MRCNAMGMGGHFGLHSAVSQKGGGESMVFVLLAAFGFRLGVLLAVLVESAATVRSERGELAESRDGET